LHMAPKLRISSDHRPAMDYRSPRPAFGRHGRARECRWASRRSSGIRL
jgi:hypothetical protein